MKNKQNMIKNKTILIIYMLFSVLFMFLLARSAKWFEAAEIRYAYDVEQEVFDIFRTADESELPTKVKNLRQSYPLEVAIYDNEKLIYQSLPLSKFSDFKGSLQQDIVSYEFQGTMEGKGKDYRLWLGIYKPTLERKFRMLLNLEVIILATTTFLLLILISLLRRELLTPLRNVEKSLEKFQKFDLDEVTFLENDAISEGLEDFAVSLNHKIEAVSRHHTELECALQLERERLQNLLDISRGVIHDLKTPLHQMILGNDLTLMKGSIKLSDDAKRIANQNIGGLETVMHKINSVLKMMNSDISEMIDEKETFDLISLYKEIASIFRVELDGKDILINNNSDETIIVNLNHITMYLILHNLFSNSSKYALEGSELDVELYLIENELHISFSNEATLEDLIRMKESSNLFLAELDQDDYVYSTGNGLYLIKELVKILHGTYKIDIQEKAKKVTIDIIINV